MLRVCQQLASIVQNVKRSLLKSSQVIYCTLALDLPLRKLNYVLFSSAYSLVRGFLCRKQTYTVTVCDTPLDRPPSVDSTSFSRHRSIAGYRPTIVLIAAGHRSVHSMRLSHILGQNLSAYPRAFDTPVGWRGVQSQYCCDVWYEKLEWCLYPMVKKNLRYVYSF